MRIFNAKWTSTSAGPSPDGNKRTEVFLAGCKMAMDGHPCKGCFNPKLWDPRHCVADVGAYEAAKQIERFAPNRYITFVGGEPLDQVKELVTTCAWLKPEYHIVVITHYTLEEIIEHGWQELLVYIDILIDGKYDETQRIWDEDKAGDGLHDVVGSGNQTIWDIRYARQHNVPYYEGILAGDALGLFLTDSWDLHWVKRDESVATQILERPKSTVFKAS